MGGNDYIHHPYVLWISTNSKYRRVALVYPWIFPRLDGCLHWQKRPSLNCICDCWECQTLAQKRNTNLNLDNHFRASSNWQRDVIVARLSPNLCHSPPPNINRTQWLLRTCDRKIPTEIFLGQTTAAFILRLQQLLTSKYPGAQPCSDLIVKAGNWAILRQLVDLVIRITIQSCSIQMWKMGWWRKLPKQDCLKQWGD